MLSAARFATASFVLARSRHRIALAAAAQEGRRPASVAPGLSGIGPLRLVRDELDHLQHHRLARQLRRAGGELVALEHERRDIGVALRAQLALLANRHRRARALEEVAHRLTVVVRREGVADEGGRHAAALARRAVTARALSVEEHGAALRLLLGIHAVPDRARVLRPERG